MPEFNHVLTERRHELRLSQHELAAKLGVKQQTISRWESGTAVPRPDRIEQLAGALGMNRLHLLRLGGYIADDGGDVVVVPLDDLLAVLNGTGDLTAAERLRKLADECTASTS